MDNLMYSYGYEPDWLTNIMAIATVVGQCALLNKLGEDWWKGLIPVYSSWTIGNLFSRNRNLIWAYTLIPTITIGIIFFGVFGLVIPAVFGGISAESAFYGVGTMLSLMAFVGLIASVVVNIMMMNRVRDAFALSRWFTLGLVFVPSVFWCILAFDDTKLYIGPQD